VLVLNLIVGDDDDVGFSLFSHGVGSLCSAIQMYTKSTTLPNLFCYIKEF
jgi:hypothetical protein